MGLSIKNKLLIFALCVSLIPITILTVIGYINAMSFLKQQKLQELVAMSESKKLHLLDILDAKKARTIDFGSDGFIRDSQHIITSAKDQSDAVARLTSHLKINKKPLDPHIIAIAIVDTKGKVIASTNETWTGEDMSDDEVFTRGIIETYVDKPGYLSYLDTKCILISSPILSKTNDQLIGTIINAYSITILDAVSANRIGMGDSGEVTLGQKSENGEIVFLNSLRYEPDAALELFISMEATEAEPMRLALAGDNGILVAPDYRGVMVMSAYQHIHETGWGLVTKIDKAEAFRPLRMFRIIAMALGIVSSVTVICVSIIFAGAATKPIRELTHATERLASGDLKQEVKTSLKDEIGTLAISFDAMRLKLAKLLKDNEDASRDWKSTFNSVRDVIILWDKDCTLIRCNKVLLDSLEVKFEDIIGKNCQTVFHQSKDDDLTKCATLVVTKTLKPVTREMEVHCLGGIFSISSFPRFDDKGEFVGTVQIMRDITEYKQAEEDLKLHSYQQKQITNIGRRALVNTDLISLMDEIAIIVANTLEMEFCNILELLPDDSQSFLLRAGVGWKEGYVGHTTVDADSASQAGYTLHSNKPVIFEDLHTETRFSKSKLLNDHGVISGMSVTIQGKEHPFGVLGVHTSSHRTFNKNDIYFIQTIANMLAEAIEREKMEVQFRSIVDNSADGIITINEQGLIRSFNLAAETLFGYTSAEVISQNVRMLMPEPYHSKHDSYLQRYISTGIGHIIGTGLQRSVQGLRSDGTTFPMELAVGEMRIGEQRMFIGIIRDTTQRSKIETDLKESYKMASLGRLSASICHEVLNPLNIISSYTQMLLSQGKWGTRTEGDLEKILEEVSRIVTITDSMLRFSRTKKDVSEMVNINSLLENIISIVEPEMKVENIELLNEFEKGMLSIKVNSDELRQVFLNLLMNAKRAITNNGKITISTQSIEEHGNPAISIKIKDTGTGIPKEHLDKIFEPFFTTQEEGKGTGLGLSISYGIVENHGGKMIVDSEVGKGTTFTVNLPVET